MLQDRHRRWLARQWQETPFVSSYELSAKFSKQPTLDVSKLVFIDESGCHPGIGPRRGWSPRGQPLFGPEQHYARGKHVSMIAAMDHSGVIAKMTVRGGVKAKSFRAFVEQKLIPVLDVGHIVCWDNIHLHKNKALLTLIKDAGASVLPLPKYSPDVNPIEAAWAKVKSWIRKHGPDDVQSLRKLMRQGLDRIKPADAIGWFK